MNSNYTFSKKDFEKFKYDVLWQGRYEGGTLVAMLNCFFLTLYLMMS